MKRLTALLLALFLLGGCTAPGESPESSSEALLTGETVSGIITKVNGNEITLDLVTMNQVPAREDSGEQPPSGEKKRGEEPGGSRGEQGEGRSPAGAGQGEPPAGGMPSALGAGAGAGQKNYTRTGESALYQIPVGATVLTLTGTSRGFNSLTTELLVTITFREDGETLGQVQVIQALS